MRVLVVANRGDADPGHVGRALVEQGARLDLVEREHLPAQWSDLPDLCLSLGSDWSVYWDHVRDAVEREADLLRRCHDAGVPILGICFGAQMLAHALGGSVAGAPRAEIGWCAVESSEPVLAGDGPWFQWHADRFVPPPGAEVLATSEWAVQAFRTGRTLALQFHPEVDGGIVNRWVASGAAELERHGVDAAALLTTTEREVPRAGAAAGRLTRWFLSEFAAR